MGGKITAELLQVKLCSGFKKPRHFSGHGPLLRIFAVLPSTCEGALITKSRNSEAAGENKQHHTSGWPQFGCGDILGKRKRDILLAFGQAKPATTYSEAGGNIQRHFFCWPKVGRRRRLESCHWSMYVSLHHRLLAKGNSCTWKPAAK